MRHLGAMITAIIVAPLAWVLLALGQVRSTSAFAGDLQTHEFVKPLLVLAAAGLLLGVLGMLRISPLGALLVGIVYTLSSAMLLVTPAKVGDLFNRDLHLAGQHIELAAPIRSGAAMVVGVLLLVGTASMRRWQRWPGSDDEPSERRDLDRPLGTDGLGLSSSYQDTTFQDSYKDTTREPEPSSSGTSTYSW